MRRAVGGEKNRKYPVLASKGKKNQEESPWTPSLKGSKNYDGQNEGISEIGLNEVALIGEAERQAWDKKRPDCGKERKTGHHTVSEGREGL